MATAKCPHCKTSVQKVLLEEVVATFTDKHTPEFRAYLLSCSVPQCRAVLTAALHTDVVESRTD